MTGPVVARVSKPWRPLLFGVCLLVATACGEARRPSLSLAAYLEVAEVEGEVESLGADLRIPAGASLTYHFAIPDEARLVGNATSRGDAVARVNLLD